MNTEAHKISCPYCAIGHGVFAFDRSTGREMRMELDKPIRCVSCRTYFRVKLELKLRGVGLDYRGTKPVAQLRAVQ